MNSRLVSKLVTLGFLPGPTHLPHRGSVLMKNLQGSWVEEQTRGKAGVVEEPDSEASLVKLAEKNDNRSVCFIRDNPITTTNTPSTSNYPGELCRDTVLLSQLGFVEDKSLHRLEFYSSHTAHVGHVEFERRRGAECSGFSNLLNHPGHLSVRGGEGGLELVYRDSLPLQQATLHTMSDQVVIHTVTSLCGLYLGVLQDKFLPDHQAPFHPHIAPVQVGVICAHQASQDIVRVSGELCELLNSNGVSSQVLPSQQESGELGIPFDVLVEEECVRRGSVTVLDRRWGQQHPVPDMHKLPTIFRLYWNSVIG